MFIGPCIIVTVEEQKTYLMSLAILFNFLCAQHVSDINISIIRSLRLFCWITTLVVLFLVRCALEFRCGWVGVVSVLQAEAQTCWAHKKWNKIASDIKLVFYSSTLTLSAVVIHMAWKLVCRIMGKTYADSRKGCRGRYLGLSGKT
jgi:hypothetical protein